MRIRRLADPNKLIQGGAPLLLAPRTAIELAAGTTLRIELDLAVRVELGAALLVVPLPALLEAGVVGVSELVTASDPLAPLALSVRALTPATLQAGRPIARAVVLDAPAERFYEDAALDAELAGHDLTFDAADVIEEPSSLRFSSDEHE